MTLRLLNILKAVADYFALTRVQIQRVCAETNDRVMRKLIDQLCRMELIRRNRMEVVNPGMGAPAPVYSLTRKGAEFLAAEVDERYLGACTITPQWTTLYHTTQISEWHIILDRAIARQDEASIGGWIGEWQVANPFEREPEKRYTLFTLLREKPRLVANPDAGFLLCVRSFAKAYYLELDRGSSGISQIANSKPPGYAELLKTKGYRKHFATNMDTFGVLSVSPTPGRRDLLRKAIKGKDGCELWKFCAWPDFTEDKAVTEAIWFPCEGEASPLVKRSVGAISGSGTGSPNGSATGPARSGGRL
jgi:hypothetical protein